MSSKDTYNPNNYCDLELLAPCGDIDSFNTAIACGADAVYLGLSDFNARRKAENFTTDNIFEVVKKAHFYGVKVYLTVNTLVHDEEMRSLLDFVRVAVNAGVDAYIVQDLGVADCLKRAFPHIVLHASTQLGVHNLYGARQAEKMGFKRVVLSRETKLEDIRAIREGTGLEIEYFVQGALCVAFSGNCYLSATECGASGNRGLCKQLCRLPYTAEVAGKRADGYLLSAKDLCLANSLKELADVGVMSFKIEGRMRREGYVGTAVKAYREMLDSIKCDGEKKLSDENLKGLRIAYSRGDGYLERAYLDEGTPKVIEKNFNNHTGIKIGVVKSVKPFKSDLFEVTVVTDNPIQRGDGLKFFAPSGADSALKEVASVGVGDVKDAGYNIYSFVTKTLIKTGWQVNVILSREKDEAVKNCVRRVEIDFNMRAVVGEPLYIKATCGSVSAEAFGDICQKAINAPLGAEALLEQVKKVGDSGFAVRNAEAVTDGVFVAKSAINALRRQVIKELALRVSARACVHADEVAIKEILSHSKCEFKHERVRFYHSDEVENGANIMTDIRKTELAVLCPSEYSEREIERMLNALNLPQDKVALQLPVIANGKDIALIEKLLAKFPQIKTLVSENICGLEFINRGYNVIAGAGHNVLNAWAHDACRELGAYEVLPSVESGERGNICGEELPLMTFAHCPFKTMFENDCAHCTYRQGMTISREKYKYRVRRVKLNNCYFALY